MVFLPYPSAVILVPTTIAIGALIFLRVKKRKKFASSSIKSFEENIAEEDHSLNLPYHPRGTLLSKAERIKRIEQSTAQILTVIENETDEIAVESTLSCLLYQTLIQSNWCGFYRVAVDDDQLLKIGPYQGNLGCLRIPFSKGVCGACASLKQVMIIPDVHKFPGHIACDNASRSELVIPIKNNFGRFIGVLDIDCPHLDGFSRDEADLLQVLLDIAFSQVI